MLDQLGRGVVGADVQFRVVYWNVAARDMFGWAEDEVLDRNIMEVTGGELDTDRGQELLDQLNHGKGFSGELWMQRLDGARFPVLATVSPLMDGGCMHGVVAVLIDITDRKRIEHTAKEGRQRLEEAQQVANVGSFELDLCSGEVV